MNVDLPRLSLMEDAVPGELRAAERKLEWVLGEARAERRTRLVTIGAPTSAWAETATRYGRTFGISVVLASNRRSLPYVWLRYRCPRFLRRGSPLAAVGGVMLGLEIAEQGLAPERVVVPVDTGATLAGLVIGLQVAGLDSRAVGIGGGDADRIAVLAQRCARLLRRSGAELGVLELGDDAFDLADTPPEGRRVIVLDDLD